MTTTDAVDKPICSSKDTWGEGPWQHEPDEMTWVCSRYSIKCIMQRNMTHSGAWRGYVAVPVTHPMYGCKQGDELLDDLDVHGGVTFMGTLGDDHVIGFDCGHVDDYMPMLSSLLHVDKSKYRDVAFVRAECEHLAEQLSHLASRWHR